MDSRWAGDGKDMNKGLMWTGYGHEVDRSQLKGAQEVDRRWAGDGDEVDRRWIGDLQEDRK